MKKARFFVPGLPEAGELFVSGDEAHHMVRVRRQKPGDIVVLFDGKGNWAEARLLKFEKAGVRLDVLGTRRSSPELAADVTVASAIAKGPRMDFLLEKSAELGAARIVPLLSERGVVQAHGTARREHWLRRLREACKQCGRNVVPELAEPTSIEAVASEVAAADLALLLDTGPEARPILHVLAERGSGAKSVVCLIGPEGGFTESERERVMSAGAVPARLGWAVLRVETAAVAAMAVLATFLAGQNPGA